MKFNWIGFFLVVLALLCPVGAVAWQEPSAPEKPDFPSLYKWFEGLDFEAVRTGRFVKLEIPNVEFPTISPTYEYGFLSAERGRPALALTLSLRHLTQGLKQGDFTSYSPVNLEQFARYRLASIRTNDTVTIPDVAPLEWKSAGPPPKSALVSTSYTKALEPIVLGPESAFVLAWACDVRGFHGVAQGYLKLLSQPNWPHINDDGAESFSLPMIQESVINTQVLEATERFADPAVSWPSHLTRFRRVLRLAEGTQLLQVAKEAVETLASMVDGPTDTTANRNKVDRLIQDLPVENVSAGIGGACQVFFAIGKDEDETPAHRLARMRYAAVPGLIAALSDRRFTHCVGVGREPYVLRVGDVALQILEEISAHSFDAPELPIKDGHIAQLQGKVSHWWSVSKRRGELASLVSELDSENNSNAAYAIVERYPMQGPQMIEAVLHRTKPAPNRSGLIEALGSKLNNRSREVLRREALTDSDIQIRLDAADQLHESDTLFASRTIEDLWRHFRDSAEDHENGQGFGREDFIKPLLRCNSEAACKCLGNGLSSRTPYFRDQLIWAILSISTSSDVDPNPVGLQRLLVNELDDNGLGSAGGCNGFELSDPEIGDLAALALSVTFPKKYHYRQLKFRSLMRRQRCEFRNIWRRSVGLKPIRLRGAAIATIKPSVSDDVTAVVVQHEGSATARIAQSARALSSKRLTWGALLNLYSKSATVKLPKDRFIRILVSRELPGEGLTLMLDLGMEGKPFGSGGTVYKWINSQDGNSLDDCSGVGIDGAYDREQASAVKCLRTPVNRAFEIEFMVWPTA